MAETRRCRKCGKTSLRKDGVRKTQKRGNIQRYFYNDCKFRFVEDDGFFNL